MKARTYAVLLVVLAGCLGLLMLVVGSGGDTGRERDDTTDGEAPIMQRSAGGQGRSNSKLERPESQDTSSLADANDEQLVQEKIISIIGGEDRIGIRSYPFVTKRADAAIVPVLRDFLNDEAYRNRWGMIANMIAWLSDKNDAASVDAILDYVRRPDIWTREEIPYPLNPYYQKSSVLRYLGLFQASSATRALRTAFTPAGAEELVKSWIDNQGNIGRSVGPIQISTVRGFAALGLVLTREERNIALVRDEYEAYAHKTQLTKYVVGELTEEETLELDLFDGLSIAMGHEAMIRDLGLKEYLRIIDSEAGNISVDYLGQYSGDQLIHITGRLLVDPCPICGQTSK